MTMMRRRTPPPIDRGPNNMSVIGCMTEDHARLEKVLSARMDKLEGKLDAILVAINTLPQVVGHDTAKTKKHYDEKEEENVLARE